jgi:tetratricopeptide (TPR) repeat protein
MMLRRQTVRRLMVLLAAVLVLVGIGAALYFRNEHRKEDRLATARAEGLAAYNAGDYRAALESLKIYVSKRRADVEAMHAYGVARSRVEEPNGKHIMEAIAVFTAILQSEPGNLDAQHSLLDLYALVGYNTESIELADRVLSFSADDRKALHVKCIALDRMRQYDKALAVSEQLNQLDPADLDQQIITYELMTKLKRPPEALLARAQKQQQLHPDDARFEMLLAMAYGTAGDTEAGKKWLNTAATRPAPDATFVRHMVRVLDSLKMYSQSQALLDRVTAETSNPLIRRVLVQRLWQSNQYEQIERQLKDLDPNAASSDSGLLAYRALALHATGNGDDARKIVDALGKRTSDSDAIAWTTALSARFNLTDPKAALAQYQAALTRAPDNAVVRFFVGEAYARLGETELAIAAWRRAAELSPSWATPHIDIARALASSGRTREAVAAAQNAARAAPTLPAAAITLASIRFKALEEGPPDAAEEARLLSLIEQIQKLTQGEPETLPIYVDLLARAGRMDDARSAARAAIANPKRYDPTTLLRLGTVSRDRKLGLEQELEGAGKPEQETPRLALARAADLASSGKTKEGLELIESRAKAATTQPLEWQLALTHYKELIRDPAARAEWMKLGDEHPKDLSVQTAILKSAASTRNDRDFIARTIERIKTLTGPEGQTWKLERARWLLGGDSGKDAAEAVNTLTDIVRISPTLAEARVLLAIAMENTGNLASATKELQAAAELEPNNAMISIDVARLLQAQGRFPDARTYLERAAATPDLTAESRRRIAGMLSAQGDTARGAKVLESAGKELDAAGQRLLAEIYRRENRPADAEAIYQRLLSAQPPELETIRVVADFYATQGKMDAAEKALARMEEATPAPGAAELIRASFEERYLGVDAARKRFVAATEAAPTDPSTWRQLVAFQLRNGRFADAVADADKGLAAAPDDAILRRLRASSAALMQLASDEPSKRPVLAILSAAPDDRGVAEFLTPPADSTSRPAADAVFARLKDAAARYPRSLPLQTALAQWLVASKRFDEAVKVAARTMESFPSDPDSARIAATVYRAAGKLDLAAAAAEQWRNRSPENLQAPDAMIAEIRLTQGDATQALKVLEPYTKRLLEDPQRNPRMMQTLLQAYALAGRESDARAALEPLLLKQSSARIMWLQLASSDLHEHEIAVRWINVVAPLVKESATTERIALANAWYSVATRWRDEQALQSAAAILDPIAQQQSPAPEAVLLRAAVAHRAGDYKTAEAEYRRGLQLLPNHPEALNNLAYLILLRGGDLNEAKAMAGKAVELVPDHSSFFDTLARIQLRQGDRDAAVASFQKALRLEPNNLEALIGLATAYTGAGNRDAAAGLMPQIDALMKAKPSISPPLRQELDALRATIKASL